MVASIWKKPLNTQIYSAIDHKLVNSKLDIIQDEMLANIAAGRRRIKRHRLGAAMMLQQWLDVVVRRTDDWAQRVFQVFCEVWLQQGGIESPDFLVVVYRKALVVLIENRSLEVIDHLRRDATGNELSKETLQALESPFQRKMQKLLKTWQKRLEIRIQELALENSIAGPKDASRRKLGRGRPPDPLRQRRADVIRRIAATGATGKQYCERLSIERLSTPIPWQKRDSCPKDYLEAYKHPDLDRRKVFRNRIADEKYKATKKSTRQNSQ